MRVVILCLCVVLAGCAAQSSKSGTPTLKVNIPSNCERILATVAQPKVREEDAVLAIARTRGALGLANSHIVKGRDCIADVRKRYAKARKAL